MSDELISLFKDVGALQEGHFLLASGMHSPVYWEKFRILQYPQHTDVLCERIADRFRDENIETVAGPTLGGMIIAFEVARKLGIKSIYAEKEGDSRAFRRNFNMAAGERILIVDDVLTTGGSLVEVIEAVRNIQGILLGIGVLVDRSQSTTDFGVPLFSCIKSPTTAYRPHECPLCREGVPLTKPGGQA
jgi:orotate phosphoribosyltransferase